MDILNPEYKPGYLQVIRGPMESGKSETLVTILDRLEHSVWSAAVIKPKRDTRSDDSLIQSRSGREFLCTDVADSYESVIDAVFHLEEKEQGGPNHFYLFDEVHFFGDYFSELVDHLLTSQFSPRKHIIVAGLDTNFRGESYGPLGKIMEKANSIKTINAWCKYLVGGKKCGEPAIRNQRLKNGEPVSYKDDVYLPGDEEYRGRCINHHFVPEKPVDSPVLLYMQKKFAE